MNKTYVTKCGIRKHYPVKDKVPKNWKKVSGVSDAWENTLTYSGVSIEKLGKQYMVEERYTTRLGRRVRRPLSSPMDSKQRAKKFAFKYMRDNKDFR